MPDEKAQLELMEIVCRDWTDHDEADIDALLAQGVDFVSHGIEPLCYAAQSGKQRVVRHLLKRGATLTAELPNNRLFDQPEKGVPRAHTALHTACDKCDLVTLTILLEEAPDPSIAMENFDVVSRTPLMVAAEAGFLTGCRLLVQHGARVNARDEAQAGDTALALAIMREHVEVVEFLVSSGADLYAPGWMHLIPLDRAKRKFENAAAILKLMSRE